MDAVKSDFYIYVHSRLSSGEPFYIGKGRGKRCGSGYRRNPHWKNVVAKDGGFYTSFIACDLDEDFAFLIEMEAIDKLRRLGTRLTNITNGGEGHSGQAPSAETRRKLSESLKANKYIRTVPSRKGGVHSEESRRKMSKSGRLKVFTDEHRKNISVGLLGNSWNKGRKNGPPSEETRKKIAAAHIGLKASAETLDKLRKCHLVPVQCIETGEVFESALVATFSLGLKHRQQVNACCNGRVKQVRGFTFRYPNTLA